MFFPSSEIEVAAILSEAKEPLSVAGGNTRVLAPSGSKIISTSKLSGVIDYEPGALTMIAKAGTPLSEIQKTLTSEGQCLAFDPYNWSRFINKKGSSTIGGVFAANVSGSSRLRVGAARDFLLGIRLVDGLGNIIQNGGRVMKNVTGYDLVKLFAGSWGTLGILTEVSFKVLPKPETEATIVIHGMNDQLALDAMIDATATPFDVSGLAHFPKQKETMIRVEGFENSVKYRVERLMGIVKQYREINTLDADKSMEVWRNISLLSSLKSNNDDLWRLSVKPTASTQIVQKTKFNDYFYDWGGGLIWGLASPNQDVREHVPAGSGHGTCLQTKSKKIPMFHPYDSTISGIKEGIRKSFDPKQILNQYLVI